MADIQMGELIPLEGSLLDFSGGDIAASTVPVQIMRPGTFIEMHGKEVVIAEDDLETYVANFESGAAGQELPVFQGHPSAGSRAAEPALGWFKRLYTQAIDGLKTLWADIQLTELGQQMLKGGMFKYLSPTIDLETKIIRGGGFVNLPAIKGQPAIEFSAFLHEPEEQDERWLARTVRQLRAFFAAHPDEDEELADMASTEHDETDGGEQPMSEERNEAQLEELRTQIRAEVEAEFAERKDEIAELSEKIRKETREQVLAEMAEKQKLEAEVGEFAAQLTSGDAGLSAPKDEVAAFLLGLDEEQREAAKKLLSQKVVDFSEKGHTGAGAGKPEKLPDAMRSALRMHLQGRTDITEAVASFCEANEIEAGDFDLSEFLPKEKED